MKLNRIICLIGVCLSFQYSLLAQDKSGIKFGKVTPQDFEIKSNAVDSSSDAVIIADIGSSEFEGNNKGYFSLRFKRTTRIKILNKNGLDVANVEIPLYTQGNNEEKLENLKGYTYNLEGGKVIETKLESESVFKDKLSKRWTIKKFTMPAVKEGSIIEYSYTIISDFFFNLQPWSFEGEYPRLWSEYEVNIPEYFHYVFLSQGFKSFHINKQSTSNGRWTIMIGGNSSDRSERFELTGTINTTRWVMKDLPALKEEAYTSTIENHISKTQFQLAVIQFPNSQMQNFMGDWSKLAEDLMKGDDFGADLARQNNWLDDDMRSITGGATTPLEKANAIYNYVHKNFTATSRSGMSLTNNLKTIFKGRNGNVADINLLLTAMMRHENIDAKPMILSTKSHGYTNELYPILEKFNYVVCAVAIDNKQYFLDATKPGLSFGMLNWDCYNGHARIIDAHESIPVYLDADELKEAKLSTVIIINSDKGEWTGSMTSNPGIYESMHIKDEVKEKGQEDFFKKIRAAYSFDIKMENMKVDSAARGDAQAVSVHYDFDLNLNKDDELIYFNPLLAESYKENPFKSADRKYPVEMPYVIDETYVANIQTPEGYEIDELPKSARVNYNEEDGQFEYLIGKTDDGIQMRCRVKLNRANFQPEEYETLRDFFSYIVKKQSEQIVYKKKK